jgi:hypothetical protein
MVRAAVGTKLQATSSVPVASWTMAAILRQITMQMTRARVVGTAVMAAMGTKLQATSSVPAICLLNTRTILREAFLFNPHLSVHAVFVS